MLLYGEGKRGLELDKTGVRLENEIPKIRVGAKATRIIRDDGKVDDITAPKPMLDGPDLRTCCVGLAQTCCANGRVIHACIGIAGCDFGDNGACR